ncbi:hypothetical protein N0V90_002972 [Kalmusia sp. IMI 367209]|nr:hypothetical protein N0V90_002972 [Kalmusia sp. IMI 367209]
MAALPPNIVEKYASIIDSILARSDLNTITAKAIRKGLQEELGHDISGDKKAVTDLIMARFDKFNAEQNGVPEPEEPVPSVEAPATNGHAGKRTPEDDSALSEPDDSPPKKKQKKQKSIEDDDAAYAARLQAEEDRTSRARATRGGNTKRKAPAPKKKKEKKKSSNKVKDEDDSDIASGSGGEKKSPKRTGGFHLSRPQTVKKIWEYVKARNLQNPDDKRQILCDDAMRAVFKQDSVHMFTMNKILSTNMYPVDEE